MLTPSPGAPTYERGADVRRIKDALNDLGAEGLCNALGLCDGTARRTGGAWYRTARGVCVLCPSHSDRTPSCNVDDVEREIRWKCRSCPAGGYVLDLVAAARGIDAKASFRDLLDEGARIAGVADTRGAVAARTQPPPRRASPSPVKAAPLDLDAFARVADVILNDPLTALDRHVEPPDERECCACGCVDVRRYLDGRGILDLAMRDGWRSLPVYRDERGQLVRNVVAAVGRAAWEASGLMRPGWPAEFKRAHHRVIIPWRDRTGRVTALQRRLLLVAPFEPQCPACDERGRCATYPHRRLITSPDDPRIPASEADAVGFGKYDNAGKVTDPYGAHRLSDHGGPVAFVEGSADALSFEARKRWFKGETWVALAIGSTSTWCKEWGELARDREVVIGLDADAKPKTREVVDSRRREMGADLEGVARTVNVRLPHLDGCAHEKVDWSDVWCAANR